MQLHFSTQAKQDILTLNHNVAGTPHHKNFCVLENSLDGIRLGFVVVNSGQDSARNKYNVRNVSTVKQPI